MIPATNNFFIAGGSLPRDAPCYVARKADRELWDALRSGTYCFLLTSRQMGKSSMLVRTASRLQEEGARSVLLDLTAIGLNLSVDQWYRGMLTLIGQQLCCESELISEWKRRSEESPVQRLFGVIGWLIRASEEPLFIFVDEIEVVRSLPFPADEFFAAIREAHNRRQIDPDWERVTFCLSGVATPSELIGNPFTTPFNLGRRIELTDFTIEEAKPLAIGLALGDVGKPGHEPEIAYRLLDRVMFWTGGHPYLTQRLCWALSRDESVYNERSVDRICTELFLSHGAYAARDDNLLFVRDWLTNLQSTYPGLLQLYLAIRTSRRIRTDRSDPVFIALRLSGVVRELVGGSFRVKNQIYSRVFDPAWVRANLPGSELRHLRAAYIRGVLRGATTVGIALASLGFFSFTTYEERQRIARDLALSQMDRGVRRLTSGDSRGLLDLAAACETAEGLGPVERSSKAVWSGWHSAVGPRVIDVVGQRAPIACIASNSEGSLVATGSDDGEVCLWRSEDRVLLRRWQVAEPITSLAVAKRGLAVACSSGSKVFLWDLASSGPTPIQFARRGPASHLLISDDGGFIAARDSRSVQLWDCSRPKAPALDLEGLITGMAFNARWRQFAVSQMRSFSLWHISRKASMIHMVEAIPPLNDPAYSPDGKLLAIAGRNEVLIYESSSGRKRATWKVSPHTPERLVFSADSRLLAAVAGNDAILWSVQGNAPTGFPVAHQEPIQQLAFSSGSGREIMTLSGGVARKWDTKSGNLLGIPMRCPRRIHCFAVADAGRSVVTGTDTGVIAWWRDRTSWNRQEIRSRGALLAAQLTESGQLVMLHPREILVADISKRAATRRIKLRDEVLTPAAISRDAVTVAASTSAGIMCQTTADPPIHYQRLLERGIPQSIAFAGAGHSLIVARRNGPIHLYGDGPWRLRAAAQEPDTPSSRTIISSKDGSLICVYGRSAWQLYNADDLRPIGPVGRTRERISVATFSPNSQLVVIAAGATVQVRSTTSFQLIGTLRFDNPVVGVAVKSEPSLLACGTSDGSIHLQDLQTLRRVGTRIHTVGTPRKIAFILDGNALASGSGTGTVQVWDVLSGLAMAPALAEGRELRELTEHSEGKLLLCQYADGVCLYRSGELSLSNRAIWELTRAASGENLPKDGISDPLGWREWRQLLTKHASSSNWNSIRH